MAKYQRKPTPFPPIEANRALAGSMGVLGVKTREDGTHYVTTIHGRDVDVSPGEWVVQESDGEHYFTYSDEFFRERYERSPEAMAIVERA